MDNPHRPPEERQMNELEEKIHNCPLGHTDVERCQPREGSTTQYDFCRCKVCGFTAESHIWQRQYSDQSPRDRAAALRAEADAIERAEDLREFEANMARLGWKVNDVVSDGREELFVEIHDSQGVFHLS